ncbi:MAG: hypothetical protein GY751_17470 [Bacteroidetes bacterium]|nr:hypothetical protein [Bacteroidota bacterium]
MLFAILNIAFISSPVASMTQSTLLYGTPVQVTVNSYTCSENDDLVTGHITQDVKGKDGKVVIEQGAYVRIDADRESRSGVGRAGWVNLNFRSAAAVDGQEILLSGSKRIEGVSERRKTMGVGIGVGLLIWPMLAYLAKQGGPAEIEANTIVDGIVVSGNYEIR